MTIRERGLHVRRRKCFGTVLESIRRWKVFRKPTNLDFFIAFFVPGFIALQIYGLFVGIDGSDITKRLPAVVGYSSIHYALTGWVLLRWPNGVAGTVTAYLVILVLPIFWAPIILPGIRAGDPIEVILKLDTAERIVDVPADLAIALEKNKRVKPA